jgi:pyruvate/2-oxoglutarate dehydrogenase complex dihydrolipoamide dehydrogenase (E3) component
MERMRRLRSSISPNDSARRFSDAGIDVYLGEGRFVDRDAIEVGPARLRFKKAVIATGGRAANLSVPGAEQVEVLTNESLFSLTSLPRRLIVIGGGPIGCEMAQSFARFGADVTIVERSARLLSRDDPDAADLVRDAMLHDGVRFEMCCNVVRLEQTDADKVVLVQRGDREFRILGDAILVAAGRSPNVDGMGLESAGVRFDRNLGVDVNDKLQTSNPSIYAAGDVASRFRFTHAADFMARIVIRNALFLGREKASDLVIPWATYTSPEVAHVGITSEQAAATPNKVTTLTIQLKDVDRALLDGDASGFVRVHLRRDSDRLLGATVVAGNAGDLISELTLALKQGIGMKRIASTIHPYPTQAEAVRKLGDQYNRTRLTPTVAALIRRWLSWTR